MSNPTVFTDLGPSPEFTACEARAASAAAHRTSVKATNALILDLVRADERGQRMREIRHCLVMGAVMSLPVLFVALLVLASGMGA